MTALSDLLAEANVQAWSSREIARRAEKNGHKLSYASASVYLGGRHGVPTEAVLAAFSDVLNIQIDKLREAAGVPAGADTPWTPPTEANRLDIRQRRALEELIRSMVASETIGEDHSDDEQDTASMVRDARPDGVTPERENTAKRPLPQDVFGLAASRGPRGREGIDRRAAEAGEESQDPEG